MKKYENYHPSILDIKFYLHDEDGNEIENKDGTTKEFNSFSNFSSVISYPFCC